MRLSLVLVFVQVWIFLDLVSCRSTASRYAYTEHNETVLLESWKKIQENVRWFKDEAVKRVLPTLLRFSNGLDVNRDCMSSVQKLVFAANRLDVWALRMLDATGKVESGYLEGTTTSLGSYDECLRVVAPGVNDMEPDFVGQYCTVDFTVPLPPKPDYYTIFNTIEGVKNIAADNPLFSEVKHLIQFAYIVAVRFGACVPSTCTKDDINQISNKIADVIGVISHVTHCEVKTALSFTAFQYVAIIFLITLGVVAVCCSIMDAYPNVWSCDSRLKQTSRTQKLVCAFSINRHMVGLLRPPADQRLASLHGITFLTITWIVIGQSYVQVNYQLIREIRIAKSIVQTFLFQPVVNAALAMDTLFFLTGLLIVYHESPKLKRFGNRFGKSFCTLSLSLVKKIWRMMPMVAIGVALAILLPLTSDGPIWWETVKDNTEACYENWWASLLFIQNFYKVDNMCLPHLWYFSVDMQLYFAALLFLLIYNWKQTVGIVYGLTMVLISWGLSGYFTFYLKGLPTIIVANPDMAHSKRNLFINQYLPHIHLGPYAVGLLLGAFLTRKPVFRVSRPLQYFLWIASIAINASVCYGTVIWNKGKTPEAVETVAYAALSRTAWSLGLTWMIIACYFGYGGVVSRVLSWKPFVFLSRLTLPAYLMHLLAIWFFVGRQRATIMGQQHHAISLNVSGVASCFFVAFLFKIFFEGPLIQLGKILLFDVKDQSPNATSQDVTEKVSGDLVHHLKGAISSPTSNSNDLGLIKTLSHSRKDSNHIEDRSYVYRL